MGAYCWGSSTTVASPKSSETGADRAGLANSSTARSTSASSMSGATSAQRELGAAVGLAAGHCEVRRHEGLAGGVEVELAAGLGLGGLDAGGGELDLTVDGGLADVLGDLRRARPRGRSRRRRRRGRGPRRRCSSPRAVGGPRSGARRPRRPRRRGRPTGRPRPGRARGCRRRAPVTLTCSGSARRSSRPAARVRSARAGLLPAHVDAGDGGAARHLVAGEGTGRGVAAGGQQHEDTEDQHHGLGAAGLAVVGGSLGVSAHRASLKTVVDSVESSVAGR